MFGETCKRGTGGLNGSGGTSGCLKVPDELWGRRS